jgi:DNA polymerase-3 subunit alpha
MLYLIFDTETTGLPKDWNKPLSDSDNWPRLVQMSWILSDGVNEQEFDYIIKPSGFTISEEVSKIHGITQEIAEKEGKDLEFVLNLFRGCLHIANKVIAHNVDFDKSIVGAEFFRLFKDDRFEKKLKEKEIFCTMKKSVDICNIAGTHAGQNKYPRLIELYKHLFNEEFSGAHNSLMDTRACARCYFELKKNIKK